MPRAGYLILLALLLAAAAAGVLVWTKYLEIPQLSAPSTTSDSAEAKDEKWIKYMSEILAGGGLVATFGEANIRGWRIVEGHRLERLSLDNGRFAIGRLSSVVERQNTSHTWPERGLSFAFPATWSNQNKGATLEIGIVARRPSNNGSEVLNYVYSTQQAGHSGWQIVGLTGSFELHTFQYENPNIPEEYAQQPVVVIHADDTAQGRAVEILGIYVKRVK